MKQSKPWSFRLPSYIKMCLVLQVQQISLIHEQPWAGAYCISKCILRHNGELKHFIVKRTKQEEQCCVFYACLYLPSSSWEAFFISLGVESQGSCFAHSLLRASWELWHKSLWKFSIFTGWTRPANNVISHHFRKEIKWIQFKTKMIWNETF